jgi:DNA-binding Lrp family transcriptional regulator
LLKSETVSLRDQYKKKQYNEIQKQLNEPNIRILSAMWRYGPRNLLEVARRIGMPFTSVYHRVSRIESKAQEIAVLIPAVSKLGMVRVTVLVASSPGREDEVSRAIKNLNLWFATGSCEGTFTHISTQLVPVKYLKEFRTYIQQLRDSNLITSFNIIYTGDVVPNFPDFASYDPAKSEWKFDWEEWFASLTWSSDFVAFNDPPDYTLAVDKKDIMIIKELEKDARKNFTDIAKVADITAQTVKSRYENLVAMGIANHFHMRIFPYPIEVGAYHQVMLEFNSKEELDKFVSIVPKLFFVVSIAKVLRQNSLILQTQILDSQLQKMFSFFSHMARAGLLQSYSAVRMNFMDRKTQTVSYELFDDEKGWIVDFAKCSSELQKVASIQLSS